MKYLGRALVAGLAALGMMMAGAVTANAFEYKPDDPFIPTQEEGFTVSPNPITKDGVDKLTFSQKVSVGPGADWEMDTFEVIPLPADSSGDGALMNCVMGGVCDDPDWDNPQVGMDFAVDVNDLKFEEPTDTTVTRPFPEKIRAVVARMFDNPKIGGVAVWRMTSGGVAAGGWAGRSGIAVPFDRSSQGSGSETTPSTPGSFSDVTDQTPHAADIKWLAEQKITTGYKDGTFGPAGTVNRQDMAAFLYRLAGSPAFDETKANNPFADVTKDTPHYKEILWLASNKISSGYTTDGVTTFDGTAGVQRQDMAAFLKRLADLKQATAPSGEGKAFTDVTADTPHADDIAWLAKTGVSTGYGNGTFGVGETVIRQDMAAFLHRMSDNVLK
ncbi:glycosyl hydrolase family 25 [Bifidobacterium myosotis]|uniref:Glycosyl hydrolase family 25 n=1 Tax=Bifidobacterium myosotis TaxID=1630166 RepID=A0A261FLA1_9BIFI|nr:S-layer homology domain-containing protein [Bifidobacterium myosotis]KAA8826590.1 S-layer homology domain-containing protein [Bifidobacterium myosotis]OZG59868.1 glycosyl hydrolase family 25 [Bifidobacterium myosotis]